MNTSVLWLVAIAQIIHVLLEETPRFVNWAKNYNPKFDLKLFILGNSVIGGYMLISLVLATAYPSNWTLVLGLSTASFIFFNFLYHAYTTLSSGVYSPGVVTGGAISVPVALYVYWACHSDGALNIGVAAASILVGFLPMLLIIKSIGMKPHNIQENVRT